MYWTEEWDTEYKMVQEMALLWQIILKATELRICGAMPMELDLKSILGQNRPDCYVRVVR